MCWGAYCTDSGDGAFGVTLTYDDPSDAVKDARYKAACQTPSNRCAGADTYNSCDEYPFKITSDADLEDAVSRCVTTNAQSSKHLISSSQPKDNWHFLTSCVLLVQGGKISALTRTLTAPAQFIIIFGNPGDAQYWEYPPTCDNSDRAEWQNGGPAPSPSNPPSRKRNYYITERGTEILSPTTLEIGHKITSFQVNQTRVDENVRRLGKRDHDTEYHTVDDWVASKLIEE